MSPPRKARQDRPLPPQARYDDYGFVALDVSPAAPGQTTTMVLRFINEQGRELDRVVFSRTAGA